MIVFYQIVPSRPERDVRNDIRTALLESLGDFVKATRG